MLYIYSDSNLNLEKNSNDIIVWNINVNLNKLLNLFYNITKCITSNAPLPIVGRVNVPIGDVTISHSYKNSNWWD